jgi:hypothetical protein
LKILPFGGIYFSSEGDTSCGREILPIILWEGDTSSRREILPLGGMYFL